MKIRFSTLATFVILIAALSGFTRFWLIPTVGSMLVDPQTGPASQARLLNADTMLTQAITAYREARRASRQLRYEVADRVASAPALAAALALPANTDALATARRVEVFTALEVAAQPVVEQAEYFIALDTTGREIARNKDPRPVRRDFSTVPAVLEMLGQGGGADPREIVVADPELTGRPEFVVLNAVPIRDGSGLRGVLLMQNAIDQALAARERRLTITDVGFFSASRLMASTLSETAHQDLNQWLATEGKPLANMVIERGTFAAVVKRALVNGETHLVALASGVFTDAPGTVATVLVMNVDRELGFLERVGNVLAIATIIVLLLGSALILVFLSRAYRVVDFVIEGAHAIIMSGNKDYEFHSTDPYLSEIGSTLNLMNAALTGKFVAETEEEAMRGIAGMSKEQRAAAIEQMKRKAAQQRGAAADGSNGGPVSQPDVAPREEPPAPAPVPEPEPEPAPAPAAESAPGTPSVAASGEVPHLGEGVPAEDETAYYDRLFREYAEAKQGLGQEVGTTREKLEATLRNNEQKLMAKYNCRAVKFAVNTTGDKVTLKPIPIRD